MSGHNHSHAPAAPSRILLISFALTLAFVVLELFSGVFAHSLALMSDAGHNFADALALILAFGAAKIAQSPSTSSRTFGYHRATILAALINALSLVLIALYIFWEAYSRLGETQPVNSHLMIGVAFIALVLNSVIAFSLRKGTHDLNTRSAYIHMLGDALASIGVIIAGVIILFTGAYWADSAVSVLIGLFILWSSWGVIREATDVLLESAPKDLDMIQVEKTIRNIPGVLDMHDLHVWTISSGMLACSCHAIVSRKTVEDGQQVIKDIVAQLKDRFHIGHTTIQVEIEGCDPNDMYCFVK
jgi:cobalt-zinc-cadmium efflux system protein